MLVNKPSGGFFEKCKCGRDSPCALIHRLLSKWEIIMWVLLLLVVVRTAEQLLLKEGLGQTPFKSRATVSSASFHQKIKMQPCSGKGLLEKDAVDRRLGLDLGHLISSVSMSNKGTRYVCYPSREDRCINNL